MKTKRNLFTKVVAVAMSVMLCIPWTTSAFAESQQNAASDDVQAVQTVDETAAQDTETVAESSDSATAAADSEEEPSAALLDTQEDADGTTPEDVDATSDDPDAKVEAAASVGDEDSQGDANGEPATSAEPEAAAPAADAEQGSSAAAEGAQTNADDAPSNGVTAVENLDAPDSVGESLVIPVTPATTALAGNADVEVGVAADSAATGTDEPATNESAKSEEGVAAPASTTADPEASDPEASDPAASAEEDGVTLMADTDRTIKISLVDNNGNPVDASVIGAGVTLNYYELPTSTYQSIMSQVTDPTTITQQLEPYAGTLTLTKQETTWTLEMEAEATEDNPYTLMFQTGIEYVSLAGYGQSNGYAIRTSQWVGSFTLTYDGTTVTSMNNMAVDSENNLCGAVAYNSSFVEGVTTTVTFDASAVLDVEGDLSSTYPLYAVVGLQSFAAVPYTSEDGTTVIQTVPVRTVQFAKTQVSQDGAITVEFPDGVSTLQPQQYYGYGCNTVTVALYTDEACTTSATDWKVSGAQYPLMYSTGNTFNFPVMIKSDGSLVWFDLNAQAATDTAFSPVLKRVSDKIRPKVSVALTDRFGVSGYPVWAQYTLTDNTTNTSQTKVVEYSSGSVSEVDANGLPTTTQTLAFDELMGRDDNYTLTCKVFSDEALTTEVTQDWIFTTEEGVTGSSIDLSFQSDLGMLSQNSSAATVCILDYMYVQPTLPATSIDPYGFGQETYPIWVQYTLTDQSTSTSQTKVVKYTSASQVDTKMMPAAYDDLVFDTP